MAELNPLNEARVLEEYWALQRDEVLRGGGIPQGDGRTVVVLPGLFGNDFYLQTVRSWLQRIGYNPLASSILWNVGCADRLLTQVEDVVNTHTTGDIAIIGHSRGGLLAKALASRLGARVTNLVAVGSPLGGMLAAGRNGMTRYAELMQDAGGSRGLLFNASRSVARLIDPECASPLCSCGYMDNLFAPLATSVKVTAIFSATDPIVPAASSVLPFGQNLQVEGTHAGLMFNKDVYRLLIRALGER